MSDDQDKLIEGHEYDGIQELDNHLPTWWLWSFLGAIIFSAIYWIHFELSGDGPSLSQQLETKMAQIEETRKKAEASDEGGEEESLEAILAKGKTEYMKNCSACHGPDGGGGVGPNLADKYWIHGKGELAGIVDIIENGVAAKGMPPWKGIIKPKMIKAVAQYVETFKGTKPQKPKDPQGDPVE